MSSQSWLDIFVSWFPVMLLVAIFVFYSQQLRRRVTASQQYQADSLAEQRRHNDILEKLVTQHDARLQKLEEAQISR
jgi:cytochrome c-type biogenesis protein CcmH/NrfF